MGAAVKRTGLEQPGARSSSLCCAAALATLQNGMSDTSEHSGGEVVLFESSDGEVHLDVRLEHEAIWLTQAQVAELFGRDQSVISRHIQRALADDEFSAESSMQKMHNASSDKPLTLYSLDAVVRRLPRQLRAQHAVPHLSNVK